MPSITIPSLSIEPDFPPVETAIKEPYDGLLAWGGDLSVARLLNAYRLGIFPWSTPEEPLLWWCPSQRMVLSFEHLHISHSLKKRLKRIFKNPTSDWQIRIDTHFTEVMQACSKTPRQGQNGTWIADDFIAAYTHLHHLGITHSIETWHQDQLIGGLYGVSLGKMFFGESMFSHQTDASKVALVFLMYYLAQQSVFLVDCQQDTPHLRSMGGFCIPRPDFSAHLDNVCDLSPIHWEKGTISPQILTPIFEDKVNC